MNSTNMNSMNVVNSASNLVNNTKMNNVSYINVGMNNDSCERYLEYNSTQIS